MIVRNQIFSLVGTGNNCNFNSKRGHFRNGKKSEIVYV